MANRLHVDDALPIAASGVRRVNIGGDEGGDEGGEDRRSELEGTLEGRLQADANGCVGGVRL